MIARRTPGPPASAGRPGRLVRPGLSLLEVMLALAIFLIGLSAIFLLLDSGGTNASDAAGTVTATRLAQSKMAEVEGGIISASNGGSGQFDGDDVAWSWEVTSTAVSTPNTYEVKARVYRTGGRKLEVTLSQVMFDPALMNNAAAATPPTTTGTGQ